MWGQAQFNDDLTNVDRIIPTRVGTSLAGKILKELEQDHPHACGDKSCSIAYC